MIKQIFKFSTFLFAFSFLNAQAQHKAAATKPAAIVPGTAASQSRGAKVYMQHCLVCHQADGGGVPNMNPPLIKTSYVLGDKTKLINIVLNGFATNVDIDGQAYSNNMPPKNDLKDQEIADVLTYIRSHFTNKAGPVKASEVKLVRAKKK